MTSREEKLKKKLQSLSMEELKNSSEYNVIFKSIKNTNMTYTYNSKVKRFNKLSKSQLIDVILNGGIQSDLEDTAHKTKTKCDFFKLKELREHPNFKKAERDNKDLLYKNKEETCKAITSINADSYKNMIKEKIDKNKKKLYDIQKSEGEKLPSNITLLKNTKEYHIINEFFKSTAVKFDVKRKSGEMETVSFKDLPKKGINEIIANFGAELLLDKYNIKPCLFFKRGDLLSSDCYKNLPKGGDKRNRSKEELCIMMDDNEKDCLKSLAEKKITATCNRLVNLHTSNQHIAENNPSVQYMEENIPSIAENIQDIIKKKLEHSNFDNVDFSRIFNLFSKTMQMIDKQPNENSKLKAFMINFIKDVNNEDISLIFKKIKSELELKRQFRHYVFVNHSPLNKTPLQEGFLRDVVSLEDELHDMNIVRHNEYFLNVGEIQSLYPYKNLYNNINISAVEKYITLLNLNQTQLYGSRLLRRRIVLPVNFLDNIKKIEKPSYLKKLMGEKFRRILIPMIYEKDHWYLIIMNIPGQSVNIYDSSKSRKPVLNQYIQKQIENFVKLINLWYFRKQTYTPKTEYSRFNCDTNTSSIWICSMMRYYMYMSNIKENVLKKALELSTYPPEKYSELFMTVVLELISKKLGILERKKLFAYQYYFDFLKNNNEFEEYFGEDEMVKKLYDTLKNIKEVFSTEKSVPTDKKHDYIFFYLGSISILCIGSIVKKLLNIKNKNVNVEATIYKANETFDLIQNKIKTNISDYNFDSYLIIGEHWMRQKKLITTRCNIDPKLHIEPSNKEEVIQMFRDHTVNFTREYMYFFSIDQPTKKRRFVERMLSICFLPPIINVLKEPLKFDENHKCDYDQRHKIKFFTTVIAMHTEFETEDIIFDKKKRNDVIELLYKWFDELNLTSFRFNSNLQMLSEICISILSIENVQFTFQTRKVLYACHCALEQIRVQKRKKSNFFTRIYLNLLYCRIIMLMNKFFRSW